MQCRIWLNKKAKNDKWRVLTPCVTYVNDFNESYFVNSFES